MSSYTIYYTCLSSIKKGNDIDKDKKILYQLETEEIKSDTAKQKSVGNLVKYALRMPQRRYTGMHGATETERLDLFEDFQHENPLDDVYGILTNEASIKLTLQAAYRKGQCIDELIIAATTSVYDKSRLTCASDQTIIRRYSAREGSSCVRRICDELAGILDRGIGEFCEIPTLSDCTLITGEGECSSDAPYCCENTLDYFLMEICSYCRNVLKRNPDKMIRRIVIYPLSDIARRGEMTNCAISVAQKAIDAQKAHHHDINLMIDTNGGPRDMAVFQLAVIRALKVHGISTRYALYSNFNPKKKADYWDNACPVSDKTFEYEIFDVVSGIDEFVEYGRVDRLLYYFRDAEPGIKNVLNSVKRMNEAFMTCFTDAMVQSVVEVKEQIEKFRKPGSMQGTDAEETHRTYNRLAEYVVGQIRDDMADILDAIGANNINETPEPGAQLQGSGMLQVGIQAGPCFELDDKSREAKVIMPLIAWCRKKKFYQQAYTLYVDRIDYWYRINNILKTPNQQTVPAANAQQKKTDLYSRLYEDALEEEYKNLVKQYEVNVPPMHFEKKAYISMLESMQDKSFVIASSLNQRIADIKNNINVNGNFLSVNLNSRQIYEHAQKLRQDINAHQELYVTGTPSQQDGRKLALMDGICPKFPKKQLVNTLKSWKEYTELNLDQQRVDDVINDIQNGYDDYGMLKANNFAMQGMNRLMNKIPDNLYKFVHENLTGCYRKLCRDYIDASELGNHITQDIMDALAENGETPKDTYIRKKIAITHYSDNFARNLVGAAVDLDKAYDLVVDMARYYLAFKIIRNNSNHSNGKGDAYAYETCRWLSWLTPDKTGSGPVIDAETCIFDDVEYTVTFGYQTTEKLLKKALQFNQGLIKEQELTGPDLETAEEKA